MFCEIDYENWDRREIYERFFGYTYSLTVDVEITEFIHTIHQKNYKFYPSICYCIAKTVNENSDYRYGKVDGIVGYWDSVDAHYSLLRTGTHLFTHAVTSYTSDFTQFYSAFLHDKEKAEAGNTLYYNNYSPLDTVHVSIMPGLTHKALAFSKPARFTNYDIDSTSFIPFITVGKYREENGKVLLPVTVEFHHAVNDGYHAEQFFHLFAKCCREFLTDGNKES